MEFLLHQLTKRRVVFCRYDCPIDNTTLPWFRSKKHMGYAKEQISRVMMQAINPKKAGGGDVKILLFSEKCIF